MNRKIDMLVGFFMILVILSALFIAFKMTDGTQFKSSKDYTIFATFEDIGGLKVRSPIKIGGVVVGRVTGIELKDYEPYVTMAIQSEYDRIPSSSQLSIKTSGILGEQYIAINLGLDDALANAIDALDDDDIVEVTASSYLQNGSVVHNTISALVLEDLIGKFLYNASE